MNFGQAIDAAKGGAKIARDGWNGKDQWVVYMPPLDLPAGIVNGRSRAHVGDGIGLHCGAYFVIARPCTTCDPGHEQYVAWQPGWLASQADMLADDWRVVS